MTRLRHTALLAPLLLASSALALEVAPGSECAAYCLDDTNGDSRDPGDSTTNTTDIVCHDTEFSTASKGIKFKNCQECLQKSEHVNGDETDTHWFLYNLRYTVSSCLFGNPVDMEGEDLDNSPCIIDYACLPIEGALAKDLNASTPSLETWDYCDETADGFTGWKLKNCVSCLREIDDQSYLANFVVALAEGCEQRPEAGTIVGLTDTVFTSTGVNGTEPEEDIRSRPAGAGSATLTTGAIVGIAVGAGLLLFGGLALFCVYWRKQKKYEATEKKGGDFFGSGGSGSLNGGGGGSNGGYAGAYGPDAFLPPEGNQMTSSLRHMSGDGGAFGAPMGHMKGMSVSSAEYYDKMESDAMHANYNFDPRSANRGPNGALPSHPAYVPRAASRQNESRPTPPPESQTRSSSSNSTQHPPPPPPQQQTGDFYAMHKYTTSTSSQRASSSNRSTPKSSPNNIPPPPPPGPPPGHKSKVPSLVLPSLGRVRGPKKYSPPLVNRSGTPSSMEREREEHLHAERTATAVHISQPVMTQEGRFQDRPLKGGVVSTDAVAPADRNHRDAEWDDVPMKSGKSALYGY